MTTRTIAGRDHHPIAFGALPLSMNGRVDLDRAQGAVDAALAAGVTLFDTADAYSPRDAGQGDNEMRLARGR